jgi:hypothetical protein
MSAPAPLAAPAAPAATNNSAHAAYDHEAHMRAADAVASGAAPAPPAAAAPAVGIGSELEPVVIAHKAAQAKVRRKKKTVKFLLFF